MSIYIGLGRSWLACLAGVALLSIFFLFVNRPLWLLVLYASQYVLYVFGYCLRWLLSVIVKIPRVVDDNVYILDA